MKKNLFFICIIILTLVTWNTASATVTCEHGVVPASGTSGTSCTVTTNCTDSSGEYANSSTSCTGAFTTVGDFNFCIYAYDSCTAFPSAIGAGDVKGKTIVDLSNTLASPSFLFNNIKNAIMGGFASITNL